MAALGRDVLNVPVELQDGDVNAQGRQGQPENKGQAPLMAAPSYIACLLCGSMLHRDNKMLRCQHTYHAKCLDRIMVIRKHRRPSIFIACPRVNCKKRTVLSSKRLDDLQPNFSVNQFLDGMGEGEPVETERLDVVQHECTLCPLGFNAYFRSEDALRTHTIVVHTKEYPYHCTECRMRFIYQWSIKGHLQKKHNIRGQAAENLMAVILAHTGEGPEQRRGQEQAG